MTTEKKLLSLALAIAAIALGGCGSGKTSSSSTTTASTPSTMTRDSPQVSVTPLKVSGGGSAQYRVEGGDNSIQDYGSESGEVELREAAEITHRFFVARVQGEWVRACGLLSVGLIKSISMLAKDTPGGLGRKCATALASLSKELSPAAVGSLTDVDAAALRSDGPQAFLIYTGAPERTVYAIPLWREKRTWKVDAIQGTSLPGA
jgi:hypothetical protein